ncbi:uncharacterized protein LOC123207763 [Mangifera indica]|uniref:uncharacterized protein LOC123207763 n=1 Tax=Mangifera indica TaxID=29780 RepID=UPI001CFC0DF7|nr:uncharacterized protein LOC123207763 [Mangifera indica]
MNCVLLVIFGCVVYGSFVYGFSGEYFQDVSTVATEYKTESLTYNYDRIDEVKKKCGFVLSSASELKLDDSRFYSIKDDLNVESGDWEQEVSDAPIMPFDDRDIPKNSSRTPLKLVSFWVTDVDLKHRSKKFVSVSGDMLIGITLDYSFSDKPYDGGGPQFQIWPNHTQISMSFQGIYTETKKNGGERVLCLLGTAMLPSRESDSNNPWEWMKGSDQNYYQPPLLQDDQILLVLNSPMTFTLTNRVIRGEMSSLNPKSNQKYFDKIHILSHFGRSAHYEFGAEKIVSEACNPYPFQDSFLKSGIDIYKGSGGFCEVLGAFGSTGILTVVPNWKCNGTDSFCRKLGPFGSDKAIQATDGSFKDVTILIQNLRCQQTNGKRNASSAKVAAVFRAAPPLENRHNAAWRYGVSNLTIAAEGLWKSSSGQLCMFGCRGLVDAEGTSCDTRICLYIPMSFSIRQRSIIVGSFSSSNNSTSYFPLSFEKLVEPTELLSYFRTVTPQYSYSKIDAAAVVLEKNEPFSFRTVIKKSLLHFPKLEDSEAFLSSLSLLSEDLTLHISAFPDPLPKTRLQRIEIQMDILTLGPLFGRYWSSSNFTNDEETPYHAKAEYTEKQLLLNVSAQLSIIGISYSNFSAIFLEGLYDPHVGKMYLVGCRDVRASWNILFESMDLESGLDCLIEVVVSYPPSTSRWLVNPTATISISSQRNDDDPLHFSTVKLQTLPIIYRKQREDILSHRGVEGILRILTLSFAIACILSQLFYIKHNLDSVPFMSLVMLGVQALGYSLPLITGAEALFNRPASQSSYQMESYNIEKSQWFLVMDYIVKILVMASFLLTLRLIQKVWRSRFRLLSRAPLEPHRVPTDKPVLLTTLTIHVIGYILILIIHSVKNRETSEKFRYSRGSSHTHPQWETELEEYVGLVQDFFLLPQVIGNLLWRLDCKPLRKPYFIGITVVRLLPHVYDYIRSPIPNPYFAEKNEFVNPSLDFYSKFGDIAIPVTAVFLAVIVYFQQRWDHEKLSQILTFRQYKLLPSGSRVYERIPSKSIEAELASGVNRNASHEQEHDDDDDE